MGDPNEHWNPDGRETTEQCQRAHVGVAIGLYKCLDLGSFCAKQRAKGTAKQLDRRHGSGPISIVLAVGKQAHDQTNITPLLMESCTHVSGVIGPADLYCGSVDVKYLGRRGKSNHWSDEAMAAT